MQVLGHKSLGTKGKPIRILQITDTHLFPKGVSTFKTPTRVVNLKEEKYGNEVAHRMLKKFVDEVDPHLVIFTGDIIDGRPFGEHKRNDWLDTFQNFIQPLIDAKVHWTFTPGNHDDDGAPYERKELLKIFSLPYSISKGAKTFNHTITVGPDKEDCVRLWLFDSGENHPKFKYTSFDLASVSAYSTISEKLHESGENVLGLAFFHIPLPEYGYVKPVKGTLGLFDAARHKGIVPKIAKIAPWLVKLIGQHRVVGSSMLDSGLFNAMAKNKNIVATFCGHDHYNDAVMRREGIFLCYGRVSSRTPPIDWEGDGGELPFQLGARVVEIETKKGDGSQQKFSTWIQGEGNGIEEDSHLVLYPYKEISPSICAKCINALFSPYVVHFLLIVLLLLYILLYPEYRELTEEEIQSKQN
mmetsp:Transcript_5382/g.7593  ORF Transcript_5382/g.7593 Transcript_5382/m.7593 type:complete len:413 (-) Transcript_5382:92-1330(-)